MIDPLQTDQAIDAALHQDWKRAIKLNASILTDNPSNLDAQNRLAYALLMNGQMKKAKETFSKVLSLDPYNQIASKNLKKISSLKKCPHGASENALLSPLLFLEEPGKTKVIECINPANCETLTSLTCGQQLLLIPKKYTIEVLDNNNVYVGALPDDIAFRLLKLIKGGNEYSVCVKGVAKNCISVFIRETKRGRKMKNQPSFISSTNYIPYREGDMHEDRKPKIISEEDEQEQENI